MTRLEAKTRLLDAAMNVIRAQGYAGSTVDDICAAAGVTKGSFFHHFRSKDDLALGAIGHFATMAEALFAAAPYHAAADPLDRLLGYIDFRIAILQGDAPAFTCLLGTLVQETYATHPSMRVACEQALATHIDALVRDAALAKALHAPDADWSAESLGLFMQSVLQGAFIFAKARQDPAAVRDSLAHLRRYLVLLMPRPRARENPG